MVLCVIGMSKVTIISACMEPDNVSLEVANALLDIYADDRYSNFSLNVIPCLTSSEVIRNTASYNNGNSLQEQTPSGACVIPQNGGNVITDNERHNGEMCPWDFVVDFDENRFPKRLAKAVCKCDHCHRGSCRPIHSYIPVLRKECNWNTSRYVFNKYVEEVPVGCRCVRAIRALQGSEFRHRSFRMLE